MSRVNGLFFLGAFLLFGLANNASAQPLIGGVATGNHRWSNDGSLYQWNGRSWANTGIQRWFPNRNNGAEWDVYQGGNLVRRINTSSPGWTAFYEYRNNPDRMWFKIPTFVLPTEQTFLFVFRNRWVTLAELKTVVAQQQANAPKSVLTLGGGQPSVQSAPTVTSYTLGGGTGGPLSTLNNMSPAGQAAMLPVITAMMNANAATVSTILAPACTASYRGC